MVAHFSQLHQNTHDGEEVALGKYITGLVRVDILIIEQSLSPRQVALHDMLNFLWHLLLNITFHPSQEERSENRLQLLDNSEV